MKRRAALALGAMALLRPAGVVAQSGKVWRIGVLETVAAGPNARNLDALKRGLRERGYIEGGNLRFDYRAAEGHAERFPELARESLHCPLLEKPFSLDELERVVAVIARVA